MANFGIQLQKTTGISVQTNNPVIFDAAPILTDDANLIYTAATGTIKFTNPGRYYVSWFVASQTGLGVGGPNFSIVDNALTPNVYTASNATKTGQTSGFILINATAGLKIQLINTSPGEISYAKNAAVIAGLAVLKAQLTTSLGGIQLQATSQPGALLPVAATIPFDTTFVDYSAGLAASGEGIQITSVGVYSVDWWVALNGSVSPSNVNFVLKDGTGAVLGTSYAPPSIPGIFTGNTIIKVATAPITIYLYNDTGGEITLSNLDVQAGIRVLEATSV